MQHIYVFAVPVVLDNPYHRRDYQQWTEESGVFIFDEFWTENASTVLSEDKWKRLERRMREDGYRWGWQGVQALKEKHPWMYNQWIDWLEAKESLIDTRQV